MPESKIAILAVFMLETLKLSKTLKSSRDDFNVLDNFNVSSIKTAILAISGHRSEQSLAHYNTQPSTSQLQHCSEVLSRSLTAESTHSSGTAINTRTQIQEKIEMTAATTSRSYLGSLFNSCTIQQAHVHINFGSDSSNGH